MRALLIAVSLAVAACAAPDHRELAAVTPFELARTHGRHVTVAGIDTFVIVRGEGPDLVLLHGNPSSTYTWRHVIGPLSTDHRVHAIDLPGYGFSEKPGAAPYTSTWLAGHVVEYLKVADIESADLVGSSMGGEVASEIAALFPRSVRRLVLVAPAGLPSNETVEPPAAFRLARWPVFAKLVPWLPLRPLLAATLRDAYFDPSLVSDTDVDAYYTPLRSKNGLRAFFARTTRGPDPDRGPVVSRIEAPTLVVLGEIDRLVPLSVGERYHELVKGSRLERIARAGHLPQEETPRAFLEILERWLAAPAS